MSIQTELTRLTNAKAAIQTAIEGKGVTVPSGTLLDGMASLIEGIEAGGGIGFSDFKYNFKKAYVGSKTYVNDTLTSSLSITAPGVKHGDTLSGAQLIILFSEDITYSTSQKTLVAAIQFLSNAENARYSKPKSLIRFGAEYRLTTSGGYAGGPSGAIYDVDGNQTKLSYYTDNILRAKISANDTISLTVKAYDSSNMYLCGAKTYYYLILTE